MKAIIFIFVTFMFLLSNHIVLYSTFLTAYSHEGKYVTIYIDRSGEADIELIVLTVITVMAFISFILFRKVISKNIKIENNEIF